MNDETMVYHDKNSRSLMQRCREQYVNLMNCQARNSHPIAAEGPKPDTANSKFLMLTPINVS